MLESGAYISVKNSGASHIDDDDDDVLILAHIPEIPPVVGYNKRLDGRKQTT